DGAGELAAAELLHELLVDEELARAALPDRRGARRLHPHAPVRARQASVVGLHHVLALARRDRREVALPRVGEEVARALLVEPLELAAPQQGDPAEGERRGAL